MTPTRLQTRTDIHGVVNGPAHVFGKSNGVDFVRTEFGGAPGWLLTGPKGKVWVPDSAVVALEVEVPPDREDWLIDPEVLKKAETNYAAMSSVVAAPVGPAHSVCTDCGRTFERAAALASHRRHKHGG